MPDPFLVGPSGVLVVGLREHNMLPGLRFATGDLGLVIDQEVPLDGGLVSGDDQPRELHLQLGRCFWPSEKHIASCSD